MMGYFLCLKKSHNMTGVHCLECDWEGLSSSLPKDVSITETICPQCGMMFLTYIPWQLIDPDVLAGDKK